MTGETAHSKRLLAHRSPLDERSFIQGYGEKQSVCSYPGASISGRSSSSRAPFWREAVERSGSSAKNREPARSRASKASGKRPSEIRSWVLPSHQKVLVPSQGLLHATGVPIRIMVSNIVVTVLKTNGCDHRIIDELPVVHFDVLPILYTKSAVVWFWNQGSLGKARIRCAGWVSQGFATHSRPATHSIEVQCIHFLADFFSDSKSSSGTSIAFANRRSIDTRGSLDLRN